MKSSLSGAELKTVAIIAMTCDHLSVLFFPEALWLRFIGRFTFPVMALLLAEGWRYTSNRKRYALRLFLFGLAAQLPFSLCFGTLYGNVLFTLLLSLGGLAVADSDIGPIWKLLLLSLLTALTAVCDWPLFGIAYVMVFYFTQNRRRERVAAYSLLSLLMCGFAIYTGSWRGDWYMLGVFAAGLLLACYNGQRGRQCKWLFYAYYPGHLAVLALLRLLLS